jgi:3,4-dihydroxy 2-butanone 4-phosphate synthase / GTP cyclohydrolase II
MPYVHTEDALADLQQGKMIILCDDETRENEGDLCLAAEKVTPAAITFMARYGCGLICLALLPDHLARLALPLMVEHNTSRHTTAFTVSIDAREGIIHAAANLASFLQGKQPQSLCSHALHRVR